MSRWTNPTGDVEFVVRSLSGVSTGGTLYTTNPRRRWLPPAEFGGSGGTGPWPPKPVQGIFPPWACPATDGHNNLCVQVMDETVSPPVPVDCNCEIELKPKGFQGPPVPHNPLPVQIWPNNGWFQIAPKIGEGRITYTFWDQNWALLPNLEVRGVDGTISVYQQVGALANGRRTLHLIEFLDAHDNSTRYEYDGHQRIAAVHRPDGISELWNYSPSWITGAGGWGTGYSGIEVTYRDNANSGQALPQYTYHLLYEKVGLSAGPMVGDRLVQPGYMGDTRVRAHG